MRNKNICLELKMDRVFYFAARGEPDGGGSRWAGENRMVEAAEGSRALSSTCSSSPSRPLHCWYLRFHCWVLLQGSATTQRSKQPMRKHWHRVTAISGYTTKGNCSHMMGVPALCKVILWKLCLVALWLASSVKSVTDISWQHLKYLEPSLSWPMSSQNRRTSKPGMVAYV